MTAAIVVGLLAAGGTYLVMQRGIVRITIGFALLGHAATTILVTSGGVARRGVPFIGEPGTPADPLPQAFALTAIVISFGITAFLLTLAFRGRDVLGHDDVEADADPRLSDGSDQRLSDDEDVDLPVDEYVLPGRADQEERP